MEYKIISARPEHALKLLPHFTKTCYWKEFSEGNKLNQSYTDFMLEWIIKPRIPHTFVLVKEQDESEVYGSIITATSEQLAKLPDYTPHLNPRVMDVFMPWFQYPLKDSVLVELIYVNQELRGLGYGSKLYELAEKLAEENNKDRIAAFVWACFPNSLITFTRKSFTILGSINFNDQAIIPVPLLYLEKTPEYSQLKDYFHTTEYLKLENILLK